MIKAIFLDAGGVILDEAEFEVEKAKLITARIAQYKEYSLNNYWTDTEEAVYRFVSSTYEYVLFKNIPDLLTVTQELKHYKQLWQEANLPLKLMSGIKEFLERVSNQYQIGILGQYGLELIELLDKTNLLSFFAFTETQEKYHITKPDPRYFEAIVKQSGFRPEECIMIGDRIDKDILPANLLGMKTIRFKVGLHFSQEPRIPIEIPKLTILSLDDLTLKKIEKLAI